LQLLDILLSTLNTLNQSDFTETANCIPQPYTTHQDIDPSVLSPYQLPLVLVPPEVIEFDSMSAESGEESQIKRDEWPEFFIRLFPNDVSSR
jgi:nuclear cap-binding protein subunit 1